MQRPGVLLGPWKKKWKYKIPYTREHRKWKGIIACMI
jgi:hypothetical protein